MKIGYARVSTQDQNLSLQISSLQKFGREKIFSEKKSGVKRRPELEGSMSIVREGDVVVIWKIDRLARSLSELISLTEQFKSKGVDLVSIDGQVDTTSAMGRMFFQITGAFAEFERNLIIERTKAGIVEAKKRGVEKIYLKTELKGYYEKFGAKYIENLENGERLYYIKIQ